MIIENCDKNPKYKMKCIQKDKILKMKLFSPVNLDKVILKIQKMKINQ